MTQDTERAVAALHRRLADERGQWLLIFDNASSPADLQPLLPTAGDGRILLTSRNPAWHEVAEPVGMPALDEDAAVTMLLDRTGQTVREAAERLAEALGCLPLALEQVSSYAAQHHLSLADYHDLFQQRAPTCSAAGRHWPTTGL